MSIIISKSCVLDNPLRRTLLGDVRRSFEINFRTINLLDSRSSIGLFKLLSDVRYCILSFLLTTEYHYQRLLYIELRNYGVTVWVFRLYLLYIKKSILYVCMYVCMYVCVCSWYFRYFFMILIILPTLGLLFRKKLYSAVVGKGGGACSTLILGVWGFILVRPLLKFPG
jgi:hypothetical protein